MKLVLSGWEPVALKVVPATQLTQLIHRHSGMGLSDCKAATDNLLEGQDVVVVVGDSHSFIASARALGVQKIKGVETDVAYDQAIVAAEQRGYAKAFTDMTKSVAQMSTGGPVRVGLPDLLDIDDEGMRLVLDRLNATSNMIHFLLEGVTENPVGFTESKSEMEGMVFALLSTRAALCGHPHSLATESLKKYLAGDPPKGLFLGRPRGVPAGVDRCL